MESQSFELCIQVTQLHLPEQDSNSGHFDAYPSPLLPHTAATWFLQAAYPHQLLFSLAETTHPCHRSLF